MATAQTVLIVEDEFLVRLAASETFSDAGFDVVQADSGERAFEILSGGSHIDVVFTDIRLGGALNGWDVAEEARTTRPDVRVIYASGNVVEPKRNVRGSQFFNKPYNPKSIVKACRRPAPC